MTKEEFEMAKEVQEWLRTLDTTAVLANIATWLEYAIVERRLDVQDTISVVNLTTLDGVSLMLRKEAEYDRER